MRNIKLEIEYDGAAYCGWQIQNYQPSIQKTIEAALRKILQEKVKLIASGRTDAGVHALFQVANFTTGSAIPAEKLQRALNAVLPDDIVITRAKEAGLDFHSRFSARSKAYQYLILNQRYPSAFLRNRAYFYPYPLSIQLMRQAARYLQGRHDFRSFCASHSGAKNTIKKIKKISVSTIRYPLYAKRYRLIAVEIEADGFLYNMARNIVGTLLEVGRKKIGSGSLKKILLTKDRSSAGPTAPANGLYLIRVNY